jgi:hypothetical protein
MTLGMAIIAMGVGMVMRMIMGTGALTTTTLTGAKPVNGVWA